ncbi:phenylalanine--tRNA ligase subunit beta [Alienimonas californiensis]|uniref:Phenylalanine--tRNA ligase beta subunit n=1 Tax=Alienimonas californiensis TaxID=2527989 RepID=A0A517PFP4_9PLAN|nr:phenylalanine--tRNA ligase subunit beta [Alienimonas californiensis]QDT18179.1 Phenylalanine--tRNA ligase beta subunit [Alienimonas californiensis]
MLVSRNWLSELVALPSDLDELTDRLTMSGLNLEGVEPFAGETGDDVVIDLEVTSNRGDCLGHVGVAREIAVLYGEKLNAPQGSPSPLGGASSSQASIPVEIQAPDLCPIYTARVIRGVKVGESPQWVKDRLAALGQRSVNNVADATNLAMLETGQPFHAFDLAKLKGGRIVVRRAEQGEPFTALDGKKYELPAGTGVIADEDHPVAVAGVMGSEDSEIGAGTTDVLLEAADFSPKMVRDAARGLNLLTAASHRFERGVDVSALNAHSLRCAALIIELAGGTLEEGVTIAGTPPTEPDSVPLRFHRVPALLGMAVSTEESEAILNRLGFETVERNDGSAAFRPPGWRRRDVTREADLIEEIARIHGYEQVPDDAVIPTAVAVTPVRDLVADVIRDTLVAYGAFEAYTLTFTSEQEANLFRPDGADSPKSRPLLTVAHSSRKRENVLRPSLLPGLVKARRENERKGNANVALFELASAYLAADPGDPAAEPSRLGFVCGWDFFQAKGVLETLLARLGVMAELTAEPCDHAPFAKGRAAELKLNGARWGWLGEGDEKILSANPWNLRGSVTLCELDLAPLEGLCEFVPQVSPPPQFPTVERDLNFVLDEATPWAALAAAARDAGGPLLRNVAFADQYRGDKLPAGKKSLVARLTFRSSDRTLTGEEVDAAVVQVVNAVSAAAGAELRE